MTGPEFAEAHGNDSSTWTTADFETAEHLAEMDLQPVYALLKPTPTFQERMFQASEQVYDRIVNPAEPPFDVTAALMNAHHQTS